MLSHLDMSLPSLAEKRNDQIVKILNLLVAKAFKELMTLFAGQVVIDRKLRRGGQTISAVPVPNSTGHLTIGAKFLESKYASLA